MFDGVNPYVFYIFMALYSILMYLPYVMLATALIFAVLDYKKGKLQTITVITAAVAIILLLINTLILSRFI